MIGGASVQLTGGLKLTFSRQALPE
jgi:hypothetical protein